MGETATASTKKAFRIAMARKAGKAGAGKSRIKGHGHPATSDLHYSPREWEFMLAVDRWKRDTGRQYPLLSDYLKLIDSLGYVQPWRDPPAGTRQTESPDRPCGPPGLRAVM